MDRNYTGPYTSVSDYAQAIVGYTQAARLVELLEKSGELATGAEVLAAIRSERESQLAHILLALTDGAELEWKGGALDCTAYNEYARIYAEGEVHRTGDEPTLPESIDSYADTFVTDQPIIALIQHTLTERPHQAGMPDMGITELRSRLRASAITAERKLVHLSQSLDS